jgi:hypothetical protein
MLMDITRLAMSLTHLLARGDRAAFTIAEFCEAHRISRSALYKMWARGIGPRIMRAGSKVLVSVEAAGEWRRAREADAAAAGHAGAET